MDEIESEQFQKDIIDMIAKRQLVNSLTPIDFENLKNDQNIEGMLNLLWNDSNIECKRKVLEFIEVLAGINEEERIKLRNSKVIPPIVAMMFVNGLTVDAKRALQQLALSEENMLVIHDAMTHGYTEAMNLWNESHGEHVQWNFSSIDSKIDDKNAKSKEDEGTNDNDNIENDDFQQVEKDFLCEACTKER